MPTAPWRVLLIEDDEEDAFLTRQMLAQARRDTYSLEWAASAAAGLSALREKPFDAVLVDYQLGSESGVELIRRCAGEGYLTAYILLTGLGSYDLDLEAMEAGAVDFLPKQDLTADLLERSIRYAIEHKRAEDVLRQSEASTARERELLQNMIDRIPVMIVTYRTDLHVMQFNKAFERLTGWTSADAAEPGSDMMARFYPDPDYRAEVAAYMSRLEDGWRDFEVTTRSGGTLPSRWANIRLTDQIQIGIGIDTREQVRFEQALRDSEERFRLASRAVAGVVYDWDLGSGHILRTEGIERVIGVRLEEAGQDFNWWFQRVHPEDRPRILPAIEGMLTGDKSTYSIEYRVRHADGHWVHVWDRSYVVRAAGGQAVRVVGTMADITARKELELALAKANTGLMAANRELSLTNLALRESEGRFRIALENAPVTVFTQDHNLRFTWIYNPFRGLTPQQMLGRRDDELFTPEHVTDLVAAKQRVLDSGEQIQFEMTAVLDEQPITYLLTLEPLIGDDGAVIGLRGAGVDLTELRRLEAAHLERMAQLEMHHRLFEQREMERQRIARDLHDGPIQDLLGMLFTIHAAQTGDDESGPIGGEKAATGIQARVNMQAQKDNRQEDMTRALQTVRENIQKLVGDLRVICNELRPPALVQLGLEQAIRSHAETLEMKHKNLTIYLDLPKAVSRMLPDHLRLPLFRIYQEGINNIVRHANASEVYVRLALDEREAALEIVDDGKGFDLPIDWLELAREGHLGLIGMKERAEAAAGTFSITTNPGQGTRVRVVVPVA